MEIALDGALGATGGLPAIWWLTILATGRVDLYLAILSLDSMRNSANMSPSGSSLISNVSYSEYPISGAGKHTHLESELHYVPGPSLVLGRAQEVVGGVEPSQDAFRVRSGPQYHSLLQISRGEDE